MHSEVIDLGTCFDQLAWKIRESFEKWCSYKGQVWFSCCIVWCPFYDAPIQLNWNGIGPWTWKLLRMHIRWIPFSPHYWGLLIPFSTQQKLSSVFTMESDCPSREDLDKWNISKAWLSSGGKSTETLKQRQRQRKKTKEKDKGKRQRQKTKI